MPAPSGSWGSSQPPPGFSTPADLSVVGDILWILEESVQIWAMVSFGCKVGHLIHDEKEVGASY